MTRTERALQALVASLAAISAEANSPLPEILRNEDLATRMDENSGAGVRRFLNVWDGDGGPSDETLGADTVDEINDGDDAPGAYDIEHRPRIEWIVEGSTASAREQAFDDGLRAIHDVLRGAVVAGDRQYLGGAVDWSGIESITRSGSGLTTDGLANVKACEITALLEFTSPRPF